MRYHAIHFSWLWRRREMVCLFGVAGGRVPYQPEARWLYSLRLFLGIVKLEILWKTGLN